MFSNFKLAWESAVVGFVAYPIVKYIAIRFGAVLWQDAKEVAYKAWDKVKSFKA